MTDLANYRVSADEPSADAPIVALVCEICGHRGKPSDVRWWERGESPSLAELIAEAGQHEKKGHTP